MNAMCKSQWCRCEAGVGRSAVCSWFTGAELHHYVVEVNTLCYYVVLQYVVFRLTGDTHLKKNISSLDKPLSRRLNRFFSTCSYIKKKKKHRQTFFFSAFFSSPFSWKISELLRTALAFSLRLLIIYCTKCAATCCYPGNQGMDIKHVLAVLLAAYSQGCGSV